MLKKHRESHCLVLVCLGGFCWFWFGLVFFFFFWLCFLLVVCLCFKNELFFHIQAGVERMCSCMKGKIFTINFVYFPYFDISNGNKMTSLKYSGFKIFLSLRLDKILTYKPLFCLRIGKWLPHTHPTYILMFIPITDVRVGANNTFPDGCHFKIQQKI